MPLNSIEWDTRYKDKHKLTSFSQAVKNFDNDNKIVNEISNYLSQTKSITKGSKVNHCRFVFKTNYTIFFAY